MLLDSHEAAIELRRSNQSATRSGERVQYEFTLDGARFDDVSHERDGLLNAVDFLRDRVVLEYIVWLWLHESPAAIDPEARLVGVDPIAVGVPDSRCLLEPYDWRRFARPEVFAEHEVDRLVA